MTPDPRFLFLTDSHREAIASMIYGITERKGFVLISGEVGTGKTTILHYLQTILDPKIKTVFICQMQSTFQDLLKEIMIKLDLPVGDDSLPIMSRQLHYYLQQNLEQGENAVLLIDEAQHLSKESLEGLRMLSNLETSEAKMLQIVLVGQPEVEAKLNSGDLRQLKQRIGIRRKLRPVTEEEALLYIDHRLKQVGSTSLAVFSPEALALICKHSEGIFRNINVLCDNSLLVAYGLGKKRVDEAVVKEVLEDMGIAPVKEPIRGPAREQTPPKAVIRPKPVLQDRPEMFLMAADVKRRRARKGPVPRFLYPALGALAVLLLLFLSAGYLTGPSDYSIQKYSMHQPAKAEKVRQSVPEARSAVPLAAPAKAAADDQPAPASLPTAIQTENSPTASKPQKAERTKPLRAQSNLSTSKSAVVAGGVRQNSIRAIAGDNIFSICRQSYGRMNLTLIDHILAFNPDIENMEFIRVNQEIAIPRINEGSFLTGSPGTGYKVHLGTFEKPESATSYRNEPALRGKNIEAIPREVSPGTTWYRLMAGNFETQEEALSTIQQLTKKNLMPAFSKKR
ncbi:MAG: AAA family ATPase [Syntrophaceae bacterium]|nr:AAA family ATPase [Syntrophaceae bacterium]